jgi:hypothetical protein
MIIQLININLLYFNKYIKKPNSIFASMIFYDIHAYIQRLFSYILQVESTSIRYLEKLGLEVVRNGNMTIGNYEF